MLNETFDNQEKLFRAIKLHLTEWWDVEQNRPTSAAFKDRLGVSVDREGGRTIDDCNIFLLNRFGALKAIVHITYEKCISLGAHPKYAPEQDNEFHCLITTPEGTVPVTQAAAKKLSRSVEVSYINNENT